MNKIELTKKIVSTIVGIGTAKIIHEIIKNNVDTETLAAKVSVTAASTAIGGAVSELTSSWTDRQIDDAVDFVRKIRNKKTAESED